MKVSMIKMGYQTFVRIGVIIGVFSFSALAIINCLDRLSTTRPQLAEYVPEQFADAALAVRARANMSSSPREALRLAKLLVAHDPINPSSTSILGEAYVRVGNYNDAGRAFQAAAQMGWRNSVTQAYWLEREEKLQHYHPAALRLDALLRQHPELLNTDDLLVPFESSSIGTDQLFRRAELRPPWLKWYTGLPNPVAPVALARRVPILVLLAGRGIYLDCIVMAQTVSALRKGGFTKEVTELQAQHCQSA